MKTLSAFFLLLLAFSAAEAQSVMVTGRKRIYTRPKPIVDFKKTFSIRRPMVRAATPALSRKIDALIDPVKVLEIDLKGEMDDHQWLSEADYKIVHNADGVLAVMVWMEGSGAYPDGVTRYVVVDTAKGTRATAAEVFNDLDGLAKLVKTRQDAAVAARIKAIRADPDLRGDEDPEKLFENTNFEPKDLEGFSVDAEGVSFFYDYGFPHVIQALEPSSELRLSWAEIKPFVRRDGLLARFVR